MTAISSDRGPTQGGSEIPFIGAFLGVGSLLALIVAARTTDSLMSAHAMMFLAAFIAGAFALVHHLSSGKTLDQSVYETGVVKAGVFASVFWQ